MIEKNEFESRNFDLREAGDYIIDRELLSNWIDVTKSYLPIIIYPFALAGSYIYRIIQMLIYAAIGLIFASICKIELEYPQLLRLSVVAVTPSIIISTILWILATSLPMSGFMYFILAMVYLFLGVKATSEASEEDVQY